STSAVSNMSSPYKVITTAEAPSAVGPYSQCIIHNGVAYVSGCIPFVPETMKLIEGGIEAQTEQAITNLFAVVKAAGSEPSHIIKTTVFMKDLNNFEKINVSDPRRFSPFKPARSAVEVARLPKDVGVEIECIAAVK
ncbi:YjgF-like protein, partial [Testicularia cyperi]